MSRMGIDGSSLHRHQRVPAEDRDPDRIALLVGEEREVRRAGAVVGREVGVAEGTDEMGVLYGVPLGAGRAAAVGDGLLAYVTARPDEVLAKPNFPAARTGFPSAQATCSERRGARRRVTEASTTKVNGSSSSSAGLADRKASRSARVRIRVPPAPGRTASLMSSGPT
ncbi:hypothetical protein [Streptomyces sp. NPDC050988]|uniref:hypothetical protein n=1 Tax=Streptomyces sp. NPDC050988 TaxID=3365637 RepID=UPI00379D19D9